MDLDWAKRCMLAVLALAKSIIRCGRRLPWLAKQFERYVKKARRAKFLEHMAGISPWVPLQSLIAPYYMQEGEG